MPTGDLPRSTSIPERFLDRGWSVEGLGDFVMCIFKNRKLVLKPNKTPK